jgi:hypothetical protein
MKAHTASFINALILIGLGLWAFFGSETPSKTAFIPVGFGIVILAMVPGVKKENKAIAHAAVLLTLVILIALIKPLTAASERGDCKALYRVLIMMGSSAIALFYFIKSFIDVRRARAAQVADGN